MPFPVRIDHAYDRLPWATLGLIAVNVLGFLLAHSANEDALASLVLLTNDFQLHQLITSCFLHLGIVHLLGNMLFLWVFGRYVEALIGWWRTLLLYIVCGLGGGLAFLLESVGYEVPRGVLGASGAIAGLMGFTLVAAPYLGTAFSAHFGGLLTGAGLAFLMHATVTEGTPWHVERAVAGGSYEGAKRARTARFWKRTVKEIGESRAAQEAARQASEARKSPLPDEPIDWPLSTTEE